MKLNIKQISSMEKIRELSDIQSCISSARVLKGERFSYQLVLAADLVGAVEIAVDSPLKDYIRIYSVQNAVMDYPRHPAHAACSDYITTEPGLMPDILVPMEEQQYRLWMYGAGFRVIWVEVCVPENWASGASDVTVVITAPISAENKEESVYRSTLSLMVEDATLPKQNLIYTQWFYADCIQTAHGCLMYSERHWELIDAYMKMARELGINMLMMPVISPALDTEVGWERPNSQLLKIVKEEETYRFDFSDVKRWIDLCKKHGFTYYEISHLFSQGGAAFSPNIYAEENGEEKRIFGWDIPSDDARYSDFLKQMIPALVAFLKGEGIEKQCYFHFSDEPCEEHLSTYQWIHDLIAPMLEGCRTFDALSDYAFYAHGLVENPVCSTHAIVPFLEKETPDLWAYNCCAQGVKLGNRFLSMPSYRNRILGLQLYKFGIKGFLHWGYNFYYSRRSLYPINPYTTTSADKAFQSGDAFSVYPGKNGPIKSIRAEVFFEGLQDISVCRKLEEFIGHDAVVAMIEDGAGMELTFEDFPRNAEFIPQLMEEMKEKIGHFASASLE